MSTKDEEFLGVAKAGAGVELVAVQVQFEVTFHQVGSPRFSIM